ncbi:MAG TPA: hypothetical protein VJ792_00295 [Candidatus Nitrosotalea sp.]|nr:hypothetical protein [Candidatus Nitrosotalea sp.]
MYETDISLQVNAPYRDVWKIISNLDSDPKYWKGITHMRTISKERNSVVREVFMSDGAKCQQRIILFPKEGVHIKWSVGKASGVRDIMLIENGGATVIRIQTSYKFGSSLPIQKEVVERWQSEAELALHLIKKAAESKASSVENSPIGATDRKRYAD